MRWLAILVALGVGFGLCSVTLAETFVDEFTMFGDYDQYLYSTDNAQVWFYPTGNGVRYWGTTESHKWASIVYKYDLDFSIEEASLDASIYCHHGFDPPAQGSIDVSPDGDDWTTVHLVTPYFPTGDQGGAGGLVDVSDILEGSSTAFVRARLYDEMSTSIGFRAIQFIRSHPDVNRYRFEASGEPDLGGLGSGSNDILPGGGLGGPLGRLGGPLGFPLGGLGSPLGFPMGGMGLGAFSIPEPSTMVLLLFGVICITGRRRLL